MLSSLAHGWHVSAYRFEGGLKKGARCAFARRKAQRAAERIREKIPRSDFARRVFAALFRTGAQRLRV
jgi:hypothetical protein